MPVCDNTEETTGVDLRQQKEDAKMIISFPGPIHIKTFLWLYFVLTLASLCATLQINLKQNSQ